MTFDFSHLSYTETVEVKDRNDNTLFEVVVGEVTHGQKTDAQMKLMQNVDIPIGKNKAKNERELQASIKDAMKSGDAMKSSLYEEVAAIKSWTLKDSAGNEVPVCIEAWEALPKFLSVQVEKVIERLNPDLDDEFQE